MQIIACIEDPKVIEKILTHLERKGASVGRLLEATKFVPPLTHCLIESNGSYPQYLTEKWES